jgi:hypothetical protein
MCLLGWETITCAMRGCGSTFALQQTVISRLRQTSENFYCPKGHSNYFPRKPDTPPAEVRILREQVEVCRTKGAEAEKRANLAERRLEAARNGHVFLDVGRWRGICPQCYKEQPRGGKRAGAKRWARTHCHETTEVQS